MYTKNKKNLFGKIHLNQTLYCSIIGLNAKMTNAGAKLATERPNIIRYYKEF